MPRRLALAAALVIVVVGAACSVVQYNSTLALGTFERATVRRHDARLPSGVMRYYDGGWGPPVLLIHGFGFSALETWVEQVDAFAAEHRVIAPDLFWFGGSLPRGPCDTPREQADAIVELLDHLRVPRAHVVGVSFGGFVAVELARRHPEKVDRLVLVDAAGLQPTAAERRAISKSFGDVQTVGEILIPADVDTLKRVLDRLFYKPRYIPRWVLRQILREFWRNRDARVRMADHMTRGDVLLLPDALAPIHAPTLVAWGRHDPLLPPTMGERMARSIPGARIAWFDESAHSPMLEEPERFNRLVLDFLAGRAAGQPPPPPTPETR